MVSLKFISFLWALFHCCCCSSFGKVHPGVVRSVQEEKEPNEGPMISVIVPDSVGKQTRKVKWLRLNIKEEKSKRKHFMIGKRFRTPVQRRVYELIYVQGAFV